jgi:hypothetical protein
MALRRALLFFLLIGAAGCVYLRLLEVKNQLRDFDQYFRVEVTEQFVLHFRQPVLLSADFRYLTGLNPTRIERQSTQALWSVDFRKLAGGGGIESPPKTLSFTMSFDPETKLTLFGFSPLFLAMAPPEFLEASIRSMGKGTVDTERRQLRVDPDDLPRIRAKLPTRQTIVEVFGNPAETAAIEGGTLLVYRFLVDAQPVDAGSDTNRIAEVKLLFDPANDQLIKMAGQFVGLRLRIDYRKLQK